MPPVDRRVLVVGTTTDYVEWIRNCRPGETLFLTDPVLRREAREPAPDPVEEILCDLTEGDEAVRRLADHLVRWGIVPAGVACFDDESMSLASRLAGNHGLPYPSSEAVRNCRDKFRSKVLWEEHGLTAPAVCKVTSAEEAAAFSRATGGPVVLKPIGGSGSELVFRCESEKDCARYFRSIAEGLADRQDHRLYRPFLEDGEGVLAEALVRGDEYSCDFMLENGRATLLRLTRKVRFDEDPFGTAKAYSLTGAWPDPIDPARFETVLCRAAQALGLERAICMLDFFVNDGQVVLLEMAPRPGGDCLPSLLRCGCRMDVLQLALDFACQRPLDLNPPGACTSMVGLRLHADREGILEGIDDGALRRDPRVREIVITRLPGHHIKRPPEDYDAWLLGHVIFVPQPGLDITTQCRDLCSKLAVKVG